MRRGAAALLAALAACAARDKEHFAQDPGEPGSATNYEIEHRLEVPVPAGAKRVRIWFVKPQDVPQQTVRHFALKTNVRPFAEEGSDDRGNAYLFWDIKDPVVTTFTARTTFLLTRREQRSGAVAQRTWPYADRDYAGFDRELALEDRDRSPELAADILRGELNPVIQAKLLFRWALANADHTVKDPSRLPASGRGRAGHALATGGGDTADLAALFVELARAGGLPARFVHGSLLAASRAGVHTWAEFHAPGIGWVPVDPALADIHEGNFEMTDQTADLVAQAAGGSYRGMSPRRVEYYFGNVDDARVTWSRGRDVRLRPGRVGPVRAMGAAYVLVDGEPARFERTLTARVWRPK